MKKLSIVIVVYNKWNFTKSCLNDLFKLSSDNEIIVIDNASADETNSEMIALSKQMSELPLSNKANIVYVQNMENAWHSKACNQGFRLAAGDNVLFLNNDIRVKSNNSIWTESIVKACESTNGLVGPTMGLLDRDLNFVKESNQQLSGNSYLGGWCIAANKKVWKQLDIDGNNQIWNEEFPFYFNDTDLSFRARKKKMPLNVIHVPDIVHFGKVSAAQVNIHKLYNDGRKIFLKKWSK